jgi:hypothetical protein
LRWTEARPTLAARIALTILAAVAEALLHVLAHVLPPLLELWLQLLPCLLQGIAHRVRWQAEVRGERIDEIVPVLPALAPARPSLLPGRWAILRACDANRRRE